MTETFKYKNLVSSRDFNSRYSDIMKSSVLRGFYFEKGTGDFDLTLTYKADQSSALITQIGVKIEEVEILEDVLTITPNTSSQNRFDNIYAKYTYGTYDAEVSYVVDEGTGDGPNIVNVDDEHTFLGTVELPPNTTLAEATFHYPTRGLHLQDVGNAVVFKEKVILEKGAEIASDGSDGQDGSLVTNREVTEYVNPFASIESSNVRADNNTFDTSIFKRTDGSIFAVGRVIESDDRDRISKIEITYYKDDSATEERKEILQMEWDEFDNIVSKRKM